jgi:hypothetical protein
LSFIVAAFILSKKERELTELQDLNLATFAENLQTKFLASAGEGKAVELEMVSATDTGTNIEAGQEQFSIVFRSPLDAFLEQHTYRLEHPRMGTFDLFLVPVKRDQEGFYYEACFTRMI